MDALDPILLSLVLPFGNDEEHLGQAVSQLANFFRSHKLAFELIAVDEESRDNSHAVLAMLRGTIPELRVLQAPSKGRGVETGLARATAALTLILTPRQALDLGPSTLAAIEHAQRGGGGEIAIDAYSLVETHAARPILLGMKARGELVHRHILRRLQLAGVAINASDSGKARPAPRPGALARLFR